MTPEEDTELKRRQTQRAISRWAVAAVLRRSVLRDHDRADVRPSMTDASLDNRNARTGVIACSARLAMLGLGYAAVPLYDLFCRVTGFGGTTQRASEAMPVAARFAERRRPEMSIRFDASTAGGMPWTFRPEQPTDTVQIGQRDHGVLHARNNSIRADHRHRHLQRRARAGGRIFQQDPVLLLHRTDAAAGRGNAHAGAVLRRPRHPRRSRTPKASSRSR